MIDDLVAAAADPDLHDLTLEASDGAQVTASRWVLAARSPVWKRMLYGDFVEAGCAQVKLEAYSGTVVQALVKYCHTNKWDEEEDLEFTLQLALAADYFQLSDLYSRVEKCLRQRGSTDPSLVCSILEAGGPMASWATSMIEGRPYVTLEHIEVLSASTLLQLLANPNVAASEFFLFRKLEQWYQTHSDLETARQACSLLHLEHMWPKDLLETVQHAEFASREQLFAAVSQQALKSSEDGVWRLQGCRGRRESVERVLVEGAGNPEANGVYYRVAQVQGDLYSKREVACGQPHVYTLSRAIRGDAMECRLFSSHVLTYQAVPRFLRLARTTAPETESRFEPVLQIVDYDTESREMQLSDGFFTISASLASGVEMGDARSSSLIRVHRYEFFGNLVSHPVVELFQFSLVTPDPGRIFGMPVVCDAAKASNLESDGLETLYTCRNPLNDLKSDSIPSTAWEIEEHGTGPCPTCTWIAARSQPSSPRSESSHSTRKTSLTATS